MNAEEAYQAAVAEIREAIGVAEAGNRIKRPLGRPRKVAELFPSEASRQTLHNQYAPKIEPRYSCGHKRIPSYPQCRICDACQCLPRKQRPVRRYSGGWLCRCGKVIEP